MDPLDAARAVLPAWVVWAPFLAAALGAAFAGLVGSLVLLWARRVAARTPPDAHWSVRAREAWPVRRASSLLVPLLGLVAPVPLAIGGPLSRPAGLWRLALVQGTALAVTLAVALAVENRLVRRVALADRLRSLVAQALVFLPGFLAAVAYAFAAPRSLVDPRGAAAGSAVVAAVVVTGAGLRLARLLRLARPAPPRAQAVLERLEPGPPRKARLLELRIAGANALAFPLANTVGLTSGALARLDDDELAAVLAHELGHLSESRGAKALRALVAVAAPAALIWVPIAVSEPWGVGALALGYVAALGILRRFSRKMEQRADAAAHTDGPAYARALERIYEANLVPAVLAKTASHPDLYDRLAAAGVPASWPRPERPRGAWPVALAAVALVAAFVFAVDLARGSIVARWEDGRTVLLAIAVNSHGCDLVRRAAWHRARGDDAPVPALLAGARAVEAGSPDGARCLAGTLAAWGWCEKARRALEVAERAGLDGRALEDARREADCGLEAGEAR